MHDDDAQAKARSILEGVRAYNKLPRARVDKLTHNVRASIHAAADEIFAQCRKTSRFTSQTLIHLMESFEAVRRRQRSHFLETSGSRTWQSLPDYLKPEYADDPKFSDTVRRSIMKILADELVTNRESLGFLPRELLYFTIYHGAKGPELLRRFDGLPASVYRWAVVKNAHDPVGFIERTEEKTTNIILENNELLRLPYKTVMIAVATKTDPGNVDEHLRASLLRKANRPRYRARPANQNIAEGPVF